MKIGITILAKAPIPGYTKTRLIPVLGKVGAANLQQQMLEDMVKQAVESEVGNVEIFCAPDQKHDCFIQLKHDYQIVLRTQYGKDIGERMSNAFKDELPKYDAVILTGTDCPQLDSKQLQKVAESLQEAEVVIIPALDGGYVLIAMSNFYPELLSNISWGTDQVMQQTKKCLSKLNIKYTLLAPLRDIDREKDLSCIDFDVYSNHA